MLVSDTTASDLTQIVTIEGSSSLVAKDNCFAPQITFALRSSGVGFVCLYGA